jgi:hypothetical protein
VRYARFHAITRAYDILRGKTPHAHLGQGCSTNDEYNAELARRRRQYAQRQAYHAGRTAPGYASEAGADDAWKDQVIIIVGLAVRPRLCIFPRIVTHQSYFGSRSSWALPLHCCRCILFPMHGIALRPPTLRRREQKRGRLETSGVPQFTPASPRLTVTEVAKTQTLRRSTQCGSARTWFT